MSSNLAGAHAQLAAIARVILATDDGAKAQLIKMGLPPELETMELTELLRTALFAYDNAALAAVGYRPRAAMLTARKMVEDGENAQALTAIDVAVNLLDFTAA